MIRTALREVFEAKFTNKNEDAPGKKRQKKIFDDGEQKNSERNKNNGFASWSSLCENAKKTCKS